MKIEALAAAVRDGDMAAREQLANLLCAMMQRYFARTLRGSTLETDDLSQQSCMAVLELLHGFEDSRPGSFRRWAHAIARRRMLKEWAKRKREGEARMGFAHHPPKSTLSPAARVTLAELEPQLEASFAKLNLVQQEALLWEFDEEDDAELAGEHEMSVRALCMHRSRGRKKLAKQTQKLRRTPLPRLPPPTRPGSTRS